MNIISVVGVVIISATVTLFLKQYKPEYSLIFVAAAGVLVLLFTLGDFFGIVNDLRELFEIGNTDLGVFNIVLKCLGVTVIVDFASELCKDYGQGSLSSKLVFSGKVIIVVICLPMIKSIINAAVELIG